jgi:hypothetical protein
MERGRVGRRRRRPGARPHRRFRAIGPVGFVLDKHQWVERYRTGGLRYEELNLDDVETRTYGDTAIAIAKWTRQGALGDRRVDGDFRVTQIFRRDGDDWRVAGIHLSPIAAGGAGAR